jgi:type IX secretion system PorP/SprF family membrane protein
MMRTTNILFVVLLFIVGLKSVQAQDLHFTQFDQNYLYANPAMIGKFNGLTKVNASYRTQWNSVSIPYVSYSAALETSSLFNKNTFGGGISFFRNQAGDSEFQVNSVNIGFSYSIKIRKKMALSLGFLGGINSYSLDYTKLKFDEQYVEEIGYNPSIQSGESLSNESVTLPSLSTGISLHGKYYWGNMNVGVGLFNLLNSELQFYTSEQNPYEKRFSFHFNSEIRTGKDYIIPLVFVGQHQSLNQSLFGIKYRKTVGISNNALDFGIINRFQDASSVLFGIKISDVYVGYTYDFNTSDLKRSSNNKGATELSISYIYSPIKSYKRKFDSCPVFL